MPTCPKCGKEQPDSSAFCSACGAVLDRPDTAAGAAPTPAVVPTQVIPPKARWGAAAAALQAEDFGDIGQYIVRRLFALLVDLVGVTILFAVGFLYIQGRFFLDPHSYKAFFIVAVQTVIALFFYLWLTTGLLGTTLGKALFGLHVVSGSGRRAGMGRAIVRLLFLPFDLLGLGFALATLTPRRKRIGDFVAGTEVVNAHSGMLGPALAVLILGGWGYAEYALADGLRMAQMLSNGAQQYGPTLLSTSPTPAPAPTLPERTPVPTEQPMTVPTIGPTVSPIAPAPTPATTPAQAPAQTPSPSPAAPSPASTTS